jgi:hypothetical protein
MIDGGELTPSPVRPSCRWQRSSGIKGAAFPGRPFLAGPCRRVTACLYFDQFFPKTHARLLRRPLISPRARRYPIETYRRTAGKTSAAFASMHSAAIMHICISITASAGTIFDPFQQTSPSSPPPSDSCAKRSAPSANCTIASIASSSCLERRPSPTATCCSGTPMAMAV